MSTSNLNPLLEDDPTITIYFEDDDFVLPYDKVKVLSTHVHRDIGVGCGFVNIYTRDRYLANQAACWLDAECFRVREIAK